MGILSDDDDDSATFLETQPKDDVYKRYNFNLNRDKSLPIYDAKDEIINGVRKNPVIILEGDTGCGKTTQVMLICFLLSITTINKLKALVQLLEENILSVTEIKVPCYV